MADRLDEVDLLQGWQLAAVSEMLRHPTVYAQRLVEELTFPSPGGQSWRRRLQLRIPEPEVFSDGNSGAVPEGETTWIVPLGIFARTRLPDFKVIDESGRICPLLTRTQHGHTLMAISLRQYLNPGQQESLREAQNNPQSELAQVLARAARALFGLFTTVPGEPGEVHGEAGGAALDELLEAVGTSEDLRAQARGLYMADFEALGRVTQYLCFVRCPASSTISLEASYTMSTAPRLSANLSHPTEGAGGEGSTRWWRRAAQAGRRRLHSWRRRFRLQRTELYARSGLGPANYEILSRTTDHCGSYYLTIEAPSDTELSYVSWASGNTIDNADQSWSCSRPSVHEHPAPSFAPGLPEGEQAQAKPDEPKDWTIHAFMRPLARSGMEIWIAAAMNVVFAYLAASGRLGSELGPTATPLFLLTPAILIAYIAYQREHYYAERTGWLRGALWIYVLIDLTFLLAIVFDATSSDSPIGTTFIEEASIAVMASASAALVVLFLLVGRIYKKLVQWLFRRARRRIEQGKRQDERKLSTYEHAARRAGDSVVAAVTVVSLAVFYCVAFVVSPPA